MAPTPGELLTSQKETLRTLRNEVTNRITGLIGDLEARELEDSTRTNFGSLTPQSTQIAADKIKDLEAEVGRLNQQNSHLALKRQQADQLTTAKQVEVETLARELREATE